MTKENLAARVRLGTIALVVSACSGSPEGNGQTAASGGAAIGGYRNTETGGQSTNASSGGASSAATGGNAAGGGTATGGVVTSGGSKAAGGSATGGKASGGGKSSGGASADGGSKATGGATGGSATGGAATGGRAAGGSATGGKATGGAATGGASGGTTGLALPTGNASFDYQIGGAYTPPSGVKVVSRDRNSAPATGIYNICYVNGFQVQPDEESFWTSQHPTLVLRDSSGNPVIDADWGEMLLDTSTDAKRTQLAAVVGGWITQCKADGFDAVEIDNLDSYSRSRGLLTQANNVAFMASLSAIAHQNGLAIAQKNSSELLDSVTTMGTDFAVVEECNRYSECDTYTAVYGNLVFIIEYRTQDFQVGCSTYPELSIVLRDRDVSTPSSSSYVYQGC